MVKARAPPSDIRIDIKAGGGDAGCSALARKSI
jgi:hypothetical protein